LDASVKDGIGVFAWILTNQEESEKYIVQKIVHQVKEPITSYQAEGCGILDGLRFLCQQGVPKDTPVAIFCDNLAGIQRGNDTKAPYHRWVGVDDDVYGPIQHELDKSNWRLGHVKGHQDKAQIQ